MRIAAAIRSGLVLAGLALGSGSAAQEGSTDPLVLPELPETLVLPQQPGAGLAPALPGSNEDAFAPSGSPEPAEAPAEESDAAATDGADASPNPFFPTSLESLEATRSAPLFTPSRTPPASEPEPEPEPEEPEVAVEVESGPPSLKLIGVLRLGAEEVAILSDESTGEVQRLKPGDEYEGWTVAVLDGQTVELKNGEQSHTLSMFTEYPETGAAPTPPPDPDGEMFGQPADDETMFGGGSEGSGNAAPPDGEGAGEGESIFGGSPEGMDDPVPLDEEVPAEDEGENFQ